jgi:hypothetical protein
MASCRALETHPTCPRPPGRARASTSRSKLVPHFCQHCEHDHAHNSRARGAKTCTTQVENRNNMRGSARGFTSFKRASITRYSNKTGRFRARNLWPKEIFASLVRVCLAARTRREDAGCCGKRLSEPELRKGDVERRVTDPDTDSWKTTAKAMNPELRACGHDVSHACCPSAMQSRIVWDRGVDASVRGK